MELEIVRDETKSERIDSDIWFSFSAGCQDPGIDERRELLWRK